MNYLYQFYQLLVFHIVLLMPIQTACYGWRIQFSLSRENLRVTNELIFNVNWYV